MTGGYLSMAEVDGQAPSRALAYVPGVDFDPDDPDSVGAVLLATERDMYDRHAAELRVLRARNAALLDRLRELDPDAAAAVED